MYALVYLFEGNSNNLPYATTIAVSDSIDTIKAKMKECIEDDTMETSEDDDDYYEKNFVIEREIENECLLYWKHDTDLYSKYFIQPVSII